MQIRTFVLIFFSFLLGNKAIAGADFKKNINLCKFNKIKESDINNIANYAGTSGIFIVGIVSIENKDKRIVNLDSLDFFELIEKSNKSELEIKKKVKDFRTKGLLLTQEKFDTLINSKIFYQTDNKIFAEEIKNRSILPKYFKIVGINQYVFKKSLKNPNELYSELLKENILVRTGGYLGYPMVTCK